MGWTAVPDVTTAGKGWLWWKGTLPKAVSENEAWELLTASRPGVVKTDPGSCHNGDWVLQALWLPRSWAFYFYDSSVIYLLERQIYRDRRVRKIIHLLVHLQMTTTARAELI